MMGSRCNPVANTSEEYVGVTSRPEIFDTICGDEAFQALNSSFAADAGTATMIVPAESYDMMFNLDTRVRGAGLSYGSTFEDQLSFGTERLPKPEDVVGATLDDHKGAFGQMITDNTFLMDPRFTWPMQGIDVQSNGIYGFPEVSAASSLERLVAFFDGDEARAQQCLDALNDTQVVEVRRLKRVTKKQEAPGGAATSGSSDEG
eukprot:jgi/Mesvir1/10447/Mv12078-RA.1